MKSMLKIAIAATLVVSAAISTLPFIGGKHSTVAVVQSAPIVRFERQTKVEIVTGHHEVVSGETLSSIGASLLGDAQLYSVLYDQNMDSIEASAQRQGLSNSDHGHWIFPGEKLSISIPVVTQETVAVGSTETAPTVVATENATPTASASSTAVTTATATATAVETSTSTATATVTEVASATATATPTSSATEVVTEAPSIPTTEPTSAATAEPTADTFSPSWPLRPESGGTFDISSYFGPSHPLGIDIEGCGGCDGYTVFPIAEGRVVFSGYDAGGGYGNTVLILHQDGITSRYGHMSDPPLVKAGQEVNRCQPLGYVGDTGYSTGPHLHLEIRVNNVPQNPFKYLRQRDLNQPGPDCQALVAQELAKIDKWRKAQAQAELEQSLRDIYALQQIAKWNQAVADNNAMLSFFFVPWALTSAQELTKALPGYQFLPAVTVPTPTAIAAPSAVTSREDYPAGKEAYLPYLRQATAAYGANLEAIVTVLDRCENHYWDPYADQENDGGSPTVGLARFKEATYKSNARAMGLPSSVIADWTNPYNQLNVMAWMFANGSATAWSGYRYLYVTGETWRCAY